MCVFVASTGVHGGWKEQEHLVSAVVVLFWYSSAYGNIRVILVFFRVMATCNDRGNEFSSALVLLIL